MPKEIITVVCGLPIPGEGKSKGSYGTCTREPGHPSSRGGFRGCSNDAVRKFQRDATQKSRNKAKACKAIEEEVDITDVPEEVVEQTAEELFEEQFFDDMVRIHGDWRSYIKYEKDRKAEREAREKTEQEERIRRTEEVRFITESLDQIDAGQQFDLKALEAVLGSYFGFESNKFRITPESRIKRNSGYESERTLSEKLHGLYINGKHHGVQPNEFRQRLATFLRVPDLSHEYDVHPYMVAPPHQGAK